ncbi:MAG TPA: hypothetical protein PLN86_04510 [Candidatus Hydrogenedentes bacterium]|nr:hypothetical protein [Candidatus Hydrogenedentota bacterium]
MNLARNPFFMQGAIRSVGGRDYAPPTPCPRPAHVAACVPAYVEATGSSWTNDWIEIWPTEHPPTFSCEALP